MKDTEIYKLQTSKPEPVGIYTRIEMGAGCFIWQYDNHASTEMRKIIMSGEKPQLVVDDKYSNPEPEQGATMIVSHTTGQEFVNGVKRH